MPTTLLFTNPTHPLPVFEKLTTSAVVLHIYSAGSEGQEIREEGGH